MNHEEQDAETASNTVLIDIADLIKRGAEHARWQQFEEAENLYREATVLARSELGGDHQVYGYALSDLAALQEQIGKPIEARDNFVAALSILERHLGNDHPDTLDIFGRLHHLFR